MYVENAYVRNCKCTSMLSCHSPHLLCTKRCSSRYDLEWVGTSKSTNALPKAPLPVTSSSLTSSSSCSSLPSTEQASSGLACLLPMLQLSCQCLKEIWSPVKKGYRKLRFVLHITFHFVHATIQGLLGLEVVEVKSALHVDEMQAKLVRLQRWTC